MEDYRSIKVTYCGRKVTTTFYLPSKGAPFAKQKLHALCDNYHMFLGAGASVNRGAAAECVRLVNFEVLVESDDAKEYFAKMLAEMAEKSQPASDPAIPWMLNAFSFSISKATREQCFEPAYCDLNNELIRSRALNCPNRLTKAIIFAAFSARAMKIAAECLARDWLCMSWRQFVWLTIVLQFGGEVARRLLHF
jgi:hypothetical protein